MFGPWLEAGEWLKGYLWPTQILKKRRLNFITIHYLYIIAMSLIASIIMFLCGGGIAYIDALFLSAGAMTQSGLNPININDLNTGQQLLLYFFPMVCTPIFINSFVVFVRLFWFERRFQNIVNDARTFKHTRSRTKTETKELPDAGTIEKGVRGRNIVVLHSGFRSKISDDPTNETEKATFLEETGSTSSSSQGAKTNDKREQATIQAITSPPTFRRDIVFADEVKEPGTGTEDFPILPQQMNSDQHIAFLENQRNPKDKGALRIPAPRDYDRGDEPKALGEDDEGGDLIHKESSQGEAGVAAGGSLMRRRNVTIDEPDHPRLKVDTSSTFPTHPSRSVAGTHSAHPGSTPVGEQPPTSARFPRARTGTFSSLRNWASTENEAITPYLSWQPTVGRNSAFVDLTEEQREELGGIEYRSLKTLAVVLVLYYTLFHILGVIVLLPWLMRSRTWGPIIDADGQSRVWWGFFTPASMFNDLGFTLTPDSMISFQYAVLPLLLGTFLIIVGNTGFPCMLRFVIWVLSLVTRKDSAVWEEFKFLLDHPRRCFTLLFPAAATWWLFWILVILNGLDIIFFVVLDLHDPTVTTLNPSGYRFLNALFQAASTRTAGFASVNLAALHPGIQVSYMIMMYISVLPIAISVRRTNVYEEKSLGIYGGATEEAEDEKEPSYVGAHLRRQLGFDLWYIALGLFIIAIAEGGRLANTNEYAFTLFSVLFEIVSAYGTVGLSLGYPGVDTSFSGQFTVVSKLVIIAMQVRGRHRGLPYELDRAILLPSDSLHKKEDADAAKRAIRRNSSMSNLDPSDHAMGSRTGTAGTQSKSGAWPAVTSPSATTPFVGRNHKPETTDGAEVVNSTGHSGHLQRGVGKMVADVAEPHGPRLRHKEEDDTYDTIE